MNTFLGVDGLTKIWPGKRIEVSFTLAAGNALAILGPSGCGKTTVLRMLAGLDRQDSGLIKLDGRDIGNLPAGRRGIGMVFQDHALFPHLSVQDNIGYGPRCSGLSSRESRKIAAVWLDRFGLAGFARRRIDSLSGGERQRVALARTLAVNPSLVLFDEPLSALDAPLRRHLRIELRKHQRELGFTAIYVTHDEDDASALADAVYRMD